MYDSISRSHVDCCCWVVLEVGALCVACVAQDKRRCVVGGGGEVVGVESDK